LGNVLFNEVALKDFVRTHADFLTADTREEVERLEKKALEAGIIDEKDRGKIFNAYHLLRRESKQTVLPPDLPRVDDGIPPLVDGERDGLRNFGREIGKVASTIERALKIVDAQAAQLGVNDEKVRELKEVVQDLTVRRDELTKRVTLLAADLERATTALAEAERAAEKDRRRAQEANANLSARCSELQRELTEKTEAHAAAISEHSRINAELREECSRAWKSMKEAQEIMERERQEASAMKDRLHVAEGRNAELEREAGHNRERLQRCSEELERIKNTIGNLLK